MTVKWLSFPADPSELPSQTKVTPPVVRPQCEVPRRPPPWGKNSLRSIVSTLFQSPARAWSRRLISGLASEPLGADGASCESPTPVKKTINIRQEIGDRQIMSVRTTFIKLDDARAPRLARIRNLVPTGCLHFQESLLSLYPPTIPAEISIRPDNTMARNCNCNWVRGAGPRHSTNRGWLTN